MKLFDGERILHSSMQQQSHGTWLHVLQTQSARGGHMTRREGTHATTPAEALTYHEVFLAAEAAKGNQIPHDREPKEHAK